MYRMVVCSDAALQPLYPVADDRFETIALGDNRGKEYAAGHRHHGRCSDPGLSLADRERHHNFPSYGGGSGVPPKHPRAPGDQ